MLSTWLKRILLFPMFLIMGIPEGDAGAGDAGGAGAAAAGGGSVLGGDGGAGDAGTAGGDKGGAVENPLDGLFTPEEIASKKESVAAAKAEETRRAGLTDEERAAEDKAKADADAKTNVPEEYTDFTIPESMTMDKDLLGIATPLFKKAGLTQELAQEFIDLEAQFATKRNEQYGNIIRGWAEAAKADKEMGGDKWDTSVETAQRALNTFGTPELKAALNQTGLGNHPEMIRLMVRLGNAMREDTIVLPGSQSGGEKKSVADRLYGGAENK